MTYLKMLEECLELQADSGVKIWYGTPKDSSEALDFQDRLSRHLNSQDRGKFYVDATSRYVTVYRRW